MKYFDTADNTAAAKARLAEYDTFVRARVGESYGYPVRLRGWELYELLPYLEPVGAGSRALDTGSFNTFLGLWLTRVVEDVTISDLLSARLRTTVLRGLGLKPRKPTEAPFSRWREAMRRSGESLTLKSVDLTRMPYPDGHFDYITSVSVVEHIPRIEAALAEMYRCLKPGGRLLVTTDATPAGKPYADNVRYFSPSEIDALFAPYPVISERRDPDFRAENWCYHGDRPLLTVFAAIEKPC